MKVLMVGNHSSVKGGITSVESQLLNHDWENDGVDLRFIPTYINTNAIMKSLYFGVAFAKVVTGLLIFKPDVLHMHMSYNGSFYRKYMIHKLCRMFGKKDIIHLHGSEFKKFYIESNTKTKNKIQTLLKECDRVIVLGDKWEKVIKEIEPYTNTFILRNAIKIPEIGSVKWEETQFKILFLGVLIKRKGVTDLLEAMNLLMMDGTLEKHNVKLIVAGNGEEKEYLNAKSKQLKIDKYVTFTGWVDGDKKISILKDCQLFILPSYNEGLPVSILEAISYGMPVISTNVGSIDEAVIEGRNGYLVEPGDTVSIADSIRNVCCSKEKWLCMSEESKILANLKFDEKSYFDTLKRLYLQI